MSDIAIDPARLDAFLARLPLPLRLRVKDGDIECCRCEAEGPAAPSLPSLAGRRGTVTLFGRRIADALVGEPDEKGAASAGLLDSALGAEAGSMPRFLADTRLTLRVELGARMLTMDEAAGLTLGAIVPFDRPLRAGADLVIESPRRLVGRGELVVMGGNLGLRLTETRLPEPLETERHGSSPRGPQVEARILLGKTRATLGEIVALDTGAIIGLDSEKTAPARLELSPELSVPVDIVVEGERVCARILAGSAGSAADAEESTARASPEAESAAAPADAIGECRAALESRIEEASRRMGDEIDGLKRQIAYLVDQSAGLGPKVAGSEGKASEADGAAAGTAALVLSRPDAAARYIGALLREDASRAALGLIALGAQAASEIFRHLSEDEIQTLTFEIARTDSFGPEDSADALSAVRAGVMGIAAGGYGGPDYAREVLERSLGPDRAIDALNLLTASLRVRPFSSIMGADPSSLFDLLIVEHPQTIALVLSFLEPPKMALIFQRLPRDLQVDVTKRMAAMGQVRPETLREIEKVLERGLDGGLVVEMISPSGVDTVVGCFNIVDRATESYVMETLEDDDPELAQAIKKRMFVFDDIVYLNDSSIQKVLREIDGRQLAKALKGISPEAVGKVLKNMSPRGARALQADMELLDPILRTDIEEAQHSFIGILRRLEEKGEIIVGKE